MIIPPNKCCPVCTNTTKSHCVQNENIVAVRFSKMDIHAVLYPFFIQLLLSSSFERDVLLCWCLPYHSNTEAVLFACLSSGWFTTMGRQLGPKVENSIKCLSQGHSDALLHP